MPEQQFLVSCKDSSYCIIYKRSIVFKEVSKKIQKGEEITFLWPEDSKSAKEFSGIIIEQSTDEYVLLDLMKDLTSTKKNKKRKCETTLIKKKGINEKSNEDEPSQVKQKKYNLMESQIFKELQRNNQKNPRDVPAIDVDNIKSSHHTNIEEIKNEIDSSLRHLINAQDLMNSLDEKTRLIEEKENQPCRRSYGMPMEEEGERSTNNEQKKKREKEVGDSELRGGIKKSNTKVDLMEEAKTISGTKRQIENSNQKSLRKESLDICIEEIEKREKLIKDHEEIENTCRRSFGMPSLQDHQILSLSPSLSDDFKLEFTPSDMEAIKREIASPALSDGFRDVESDKYIPSTSNAHLNVQNTLRRTSTIIIRSSDSSDIDSDDDIKDILEVKSEKVCIKQESKVETDDEILSDSASMEDSENHCQNEKSAEWTLKHPTLDESGLLKELVKGSKIYVNNNALNNAKMTQTKQTTLARALMNLVFTENALRKCTIRGRKGKRPGLHQGGVNAILRYVNYYANKHKWPPVDDQIIITSLSRQVVEKKQTLSTNEQFRRNQD